MERVPHTKIHDHYLEYVPTWPAFSPKFAWSARKLAPKRSDECIFVCTLCDEKCARSGPSAFKEQVESVER